MMWQKKSSRIFHGKEFTREELETAGTYLYLCTVTGLYKDRGQAVWKLQNFFQAERGQFPAFVAVAST